MKVLPLLLFLISLTQASETRHVLMEHIETEYTKTLEPECLLDIKKLVRSGDTLTTWKVCKRETYQLTIRERYTGSTWVRALYFGKGGELFYAQEKILRSAKNGVTEFEWEITYWAHEGKLIHYLSHGHGRTEEDGWQAESVFDDYCRIMAEVGDMTPRYQ